MLEKLTARNQSCVATADNIPHTLCWLWSETPGRMNGPRDKVIVTWICVYSSVGSCFLLSEPSMGPVPPWGPVSGVSAEYPTYLQIGK